MTGSGEATLVAAIVDLREEDVVGLVRRFLVEGMPAARVRELTREAMEAIGGRFEKGEYFLPDLMLAGEIVRRITELIRPALLQSGPARPSAKGPLVLMGTVQGDFHDIGKNVVVFMLEANGFEVVDLGMDVPVRTFVAKVRERRPAVVGLSGFLTLASDAMRDTIEAFKAAGLRDEIRIMIGGGGVDENVRVYTGADAFGLDAMAAVNLCKGWLGVPV
jgi:5-methyltetrahydrofolate--homocysteine methyltransferase